MVIAARIVTGIFKLEQFFEKKWKKRRKKLSCLKDFFKAKISSAVQWNYLSQKADQN